MTTVRFTACLAAALLAGTAVAEARITVTIAAVSNGGMLVSGPSFGVLNHLRTRLLP
jgi:hypothetical protein